MAIDQLPDLVLFELFAFLNLEEKFRLKAVCKRLNSQLTCYLTEIQKRLFDYLDVLSLNEHWGCSNQPVQRGEYIHLKLFLKCLTGGYFQSVKCLHLFRLNLNYSNNPLLHLEMAYRSCLLAFLAQLNELFVSDGKFYNSIAGLFCDDYKAESFFDLPGLKAISIKMLPEATGFSSHDLKINSQSLERLVVWNCPFRKIRLSNLENIRYIECLHFTKYEFQLIPMPNLEQLNCLCLSGKFNLLMYPKLRKLGVCPRKDFLKRGFHRFLRRLIEQKEKLGRFDLEITVSGFKDLSSLATFRGKLDSCISGTEFNLKFDDVLKVKESFANLISPLPGSTNIYVEPALEAELASLPRLLRPFKIESVLLINDPNPELAIKFLKRINGVSKLRINRCSYGPEFYNQLASSLPFVWFLTIYGSPFSVVASFDSQCAIRGLREIDLICCRLAEEPPQKEALMTMIKRSKIKRFGIIRNTSYICNK